MPWLTPQFDPDRATGSSAAVCDTVAHRIRPFARSDPLPFGLTFPFNVDAARRLPGGRSKARPSRCSSRASPARLARWITTTTSSSWARAPAGRSWRRASAKIRGSGCCLVESGPDYPNIESLPEDLQNANHGSFVAHDWRLQYTPSTTSRTIPFPRGRVVGGSSAVNTAIALRGMPSDYDEWASLGNPAWSWDKVLPAFIRLETDLDFGDRPIHGDSGPLPIRRHPREELVPYQAAFLDACAALGYPAREDHNDPETTGAGSHPMNKRGNLRISTAIAYLGPARDRPNLHIRADCDAVRVVIEKGEVRGLEVRVRGTRVTIAAPQVVLACGAIHTPAVLVRSGIGPRAVLERLGIAETQLLEGVGQNLQDHPAIGPTLVPQAGHRRLGPARHPDNALLHGDRQQ